MRRRGARRRTERTKGLENMAVGAESGRTTDVDALVVGAGFGGIQAAYELDRLGLSVRLVEAGDDVGGVWNWNRYPGARTDIYSYQYCYSFSKELWDEWEWTERYPSQPEVLAYLRFAADRLDVRRHMQFDTRVESAAYDEAENRWMAVTDRAEIITARFVILATGGLSRPVDPSFPGLDELRGSLVRHGALAASQGRLLGSARRRGRGGFDRCPGGPRGGGAGGAGDRVPAHPELRGRSGKRALDRRGAAGHERTLRGDPPHPVEPPRRPDAPHGELENEGTFDPRRSTRCSSRRGSAVGSTWC